MKNIIFSILLFLPFSFVYGKTSVSTTPKYDKIVFSSFWHMGRSRIANKTELKKTVILNNDKSMIVSTSYLSDYPNCYSPDLQRNIKSTNSKLVQGIADNEPFIQIHTILNNANCAPQSNIIPDDAGYTRYSFLFLQNGIVVHTINTNSFDRNDKLKKLADLFYRLDATMRITKPRPFLSIEGIDLFYLRFGNYTFTTNNGSKEMDTPQEIRLLNTEAYLLWNYLRKAKVINDNLLTKQLLYKYDYHSIGICKNDTLLYANLKINNKWENVKKGETDGRYFRFIADSGAMITLDIGFNFFTHTMKNYIRERTLKIE